MDPHWPRSKPDSHPLCHRRASRTWLMLVTAEQHVGERCKNPHDLDAFTNCVSPTLCRSANYLDCQQLASSTTTAHIARLKSHGVYQAKADGAALGWDSGQCFAISEVKKSRRYAGNGDLSPEKASNRGILEQEVLEMAEMAAWIAESPQSWGKDESDSKTRLLIAQDRDSLDVVFGVLDYQYVKWIQGVSRGDEKECSFLTMQSFGPYRTRAKDDMVLFQAVVQGHLGQYKEA